MRNLPWRRPRPRQQLHLQGIAHLHPAHLRDVPGKRPAMSTAGKLTSTEVVHALVQAKAVGKLTVTEHGDYVRISGPEQDRERAFEVLTGHGLSVAPYPDHDDWIRR